MPGACPTTWTGPPGLLLRLADALPVAHTYATLSIDDAVGCRSVDMDRLERKSTSTTSRLRRSGSTAYNTRRLLRSLESQHHAHLSRLPLHRARRLRRVHSRLVHLSIKVDAKAPAATFGSLPAGDLELVLEGPLIPLVLKYIPYTNTWDANNDADASDLGGEFHYLDDDTEPPSGTLSHALALTSFDSGAKPWRVALFLILEEVEPAAKTLTMKRIVTGTDRDWARELLFAPVARVKTV